MENILEQVGYYIIPNTAALPPPPTMFGVGPTESAVDGPGDTVYNPQQLLSPGISIPCPSIICANIP